MELKNYYAQDVNGNIVPGATCYLYLPGTTTLATGLQGPTGASLTNPFNADAFGLIQFAAPNGAYDFRCVAGLQDSTISIQFADPSVIPPLVDEAEAAAAAAAAAASASSASAATASAAAASAAGEVNLLRTQLANAIDSVTQGSLLVGFLAGGSGAVATTVGSAIKALCVNAMQYGAAGIGGDDTSAIQAAATYAASIGKCLYIPGGNFGLTSELTISNKSFSLLGDGTGLTKLWIDHAGRGIVYSSTDRTQNLSIEGVELISSNASAISGIDVTFPTTSSVDQSQLTLENVAVRVSGTGSWAYSCIRLDGVKNPFISKTVVRGVFATTLYGFSLEGQTIDADLDSCRAYLVGNGINIIGANEGTVIRGYTAVSVKRGVEVNPTASGPWVSISNFHINCSELGIRSNRRTQVEINNGLLYANNLFGSASWTGISIEHDSGSFAEYCNVKDVIFNRQSYANPTVGINYVNARNCIATNCSFVNIAQPFVEDSTSVNILKFNNQYPGVSNPVTKNGASGGETLRIDPSFSQNRFFMSGAATGISPTIGVEGIDTIINLNISAKGANGLVTIGSTVGTGFQVLTPASTVNRPRAVGATAGNPATIDATGTDALIWLALRGKSTAGVTLPTTTSLNFASDSAAATGGVPVGGVYHNAGAVRIRLT